MRECDHVYIYRIEHQFYPHEYAHCIPAREDAVRPYHKEHCAEDEIMVEGYHPVSFLAMVMAPTSAERSKTETTSKGRTYVVSRTFPSPEIPIPSGTAVLTSHDVFQRV